MVSNKINQEPIYLYFSKEEYFILTHSLKIKDYYHLINDKISINNLIKDIGSYLDIFFKAYPLSNRISISHQEPMNKIKPFCSFILIPDEKFKNKIKLNEYARKYNKIKEEILKIDKKRKHLFNKIKIISKLFLNNEDEYKRELTLKEQIEYSSNDEINTNNIKNINSSSSNIIENKINYKKIIKDIFTTRLNDFRKDIVEYCLNNTKYLRKNNFENFVCFLEFFCLLFCGIKTKYYIDELSYLNMDFYADEKNIMNMAESFHYQVQFRINDIPYISTYGKKKKHSLDKKEDIIKEKKEKLRNLNMRKVPSINQERVEFYPTYCDFSRKIAPRFRRYDLNDDYHLCAKCEYIPNSNKCKYLTCSSCFRQIDKEKLISLNLSHIMNFSILKILVYNENDNKIFKDIILNLNYDGIENRISNKELLINFLYPFETEEILKINKSYKDVYGENVGLYFVWISHYIKWLFYPAIIGLIISFICYIQNDSFNKSILLIINLIFITFIVLWGNYYYLSWEGQESFYKYIWGMSDHKLINSSISEFKENNELNFEIIMGVKIPLKTPFNYLIINCFLFILSIILHILMIITNILIISIKSYKFDIKYKRIEQFLNNNWKYIIPVFCFILREIFSFISEKWNKWIINHQKRITKKQKEDLKIRIQMIFEFFNYYFNLYYIAFIKNYYGSCLNNNCHSELGDQLLIIIICDFFTTIIYILIPSLYSIKQRHELEAKIKDNNYSENNSNKFIYYTRNKFQYENMKIYYFKLVLYFGYIIQFGASSPMSFFIVLLTIIFTRIILSIALKIIYFIEFFDDLTGLNKIKKWLKIISYIGILSNLCCIFYTNDYFDSLSRGRKLIYIAFIENIVLVIIKLFNYDSLPKWFYFRNKIDFNYLRKYGTREKKLYLYQEYLNNENIIINENNENHENIENNDDADGDDEDNLEEEYEL